MSGFVADSTHHSGTANKVPTVPGALPDNPAPKPNAIAKMGDRTSSDQVGWLRGSRPKMVVSLSVLGDELTTPMQYFHTATLLDPTNAL